MSIYRITRFTSSNTEKAVQMAQAAREEVAAVGADFIEMAFDDNGNGVVVARYPDAATMEAATSVAQRIFGVMGADGAIDGAAIETWSADVKATM